MVSIFLFFEVINTKVMNIYFIDSLKITIINFLWQFAIDNVTKWNIIILLSLSYDLFIKNNLWVIMIK